MSHVTDVIFACDLREEKTSVDLINDWLVEHEIGMLASVDDHAGGKKAMQSWVFLGAFNYLPIEEFASYVRSLTWCHPENVQIWIKDEHDERFAPA
jgi:hypothetical protein